MAQPAQAANARRLILNTPSDILGHIVQDYFPDDMRTIAAVSRSFRAIVEGERTLLFEQLKTIPEIKLILDHSDKMKDPEGNPLPLPVKQKLNTIQAMLIPAARIPARSLNARRRAPFDSFQKFYELSCNAGPELLCLAVKDDGLFSAIVANNGLKKFSKEIIHSAAKELLSPGDENKLKELLPRVPREALPVMVEKALGKRNLRLAKYLLETRRFDLNPLLRLIVDPEHIEMILQVATARNRPYNTTYDPDALVRRNNTRPGLQTIILDAIDRCYLPAFLDAILRNSTPSREILEYARDRARFDQLFLEGRARFPETCPVPYLVITPLDGLDEERERFHRLIPDRFRDQNVIMEDIRLQDPDNRRAAMIASLDRAIAQHPQAGAAAPAAMEAPQLAPAAPEEALQAAPVQLMAPDDAPQGAIIADIMDNIRAQERAAQREMRCTIARGVIATLAITVLAWSAEYYFSN
jgi:hypothetical protein